MPRPILFITPRLEGMMIDVSRGGEVGGSHSRAFLVGCSVGPASAEGHVQGGVPMSGRGHEEGEVRERDTESKRGLAGSALASSIFVGV
jgi:hypothetical protein